MGFFEWMWKPAGSERIYSVMNDDHVLLYKIIGEFRQGPDRSRDISTVREEKRKRAQEIIRRLIGEIKAHFAREEALMDIYSYDAARAHREQHLMMLRSIEMYQSRLSVAVDTVPEDPSQYLKQSLTNHIRNADRQLERFLVTAYKNRDSQRRMSMNAADRLKYGVLVASSRNRSANAG